jgi:hypothetical protein
MKKLISMTDFVLEQDKDFKPTRTYKELVINYANFLKKPLNLGMFVPCDEKGNFLEEPIKFDLWLKYGDFTQYGNYLTNKCKPYQQAKERVLFEGFESAKAGYVYNSNISLDEEFIEGKTIQYLIPFNLTLIEK